MTLYDGQLLVKARKEKSLTQSEVSEILGLGRRQVSQMENGVFDGGIKYLVKYLRLLNLQLDITSNTKSVWQQANIFQDNQLENDFTNGMTFSPKECSKTMVDKDALNKEIDDMFLNQTR